MRYRISKTIPLFLFICIVVFLPISGFSQDWTQSDLDTSVWIDHIERVGNSQIIIAGTNKGIFRSLDNGIHWEPSATTLLDTILIPQIVSTSDGILFASTWFSINYGYFAQGGIYQSLDSGLNWTKVSTDLPSTYTSSLAVVEDTINNSYDIFCSTNLGGIYQSNDSGKTWNIIGFDGYSMDVLKSNSSYLYAGSLWDTTGFFRSSDTGQTWERFTEGLGDKTVWALDFLDDGTALLGTDGSGIYKSTDNGVSWGFTNLNTYRVHDIKHSVSGRVYAGVYDGGVFWSDPPYISWTQLTLEGLGNINVAAVYIIDEYTILVGTEGGIFIGSMVSTGSGRSLPGTVDSLPVYLTNEESITAFNIPLYFERIDALGTGEVSLDSVKISSYYDTLDVSVIVDTARDSLVIVRTIEDPPLPEPDTSHKRLATIYYSSDTLSNGAIVEVKADTCTGACGLFFKTPLGEYINPTYAPGYIVITDSISTIQLNTTELYFDGTMGKASPDTLEVTHTGYIPLEYYIFKKYGNNFTYTPSSGTTPSFVEFTQKPCGEETYGVDTVLVIPFDSEIERLKITLEYDCRCCNEIRGDVNLDGSYLTDISDLLYLVDYFFLQPPGPAPECYGEANINGQIPLDISDLLYLVDFFFDNGPAPAMCP